MNIFLIGPMATGKSSVGKALAESLKYCFYDTDDLVCRSAAMDIPAIFEKQGEAGFRKLEAQVLRQLVGHHDLVVATGGGVVLDKQNCQLIKKNGTVVYLNTPIDIRYDRIPNPPERPLLMQGNVYEVMQKLDNARDPIYRALADFIIDNNGNIAATTADIIKNINTAEQICPHSE